MFPNFVRFGCIVLKFCEVWMYCFQTLWVLNVLFQSLWGLDVLFSNFVRFWCIVLKFCEVWMYCFQTLWGLDVLFSNFVSLHELYFWVHLTKSKFACLLWIGFKFWNYLFSLPSTEVWCSCLIWSWVWVNF